MHMIMEDKLDIVNNRRSRELLERYGFQYMLIRADSPLAYFMSAEEKWETLLRADSENAFLLGRKVDM